MNSDSVIDNLEMMAPKHITSLADEPAPQQGHPKGTRQGLPGSPGTGPNRTGRGPTAHQDQGLIIARQDNPGQRGNNREGEQAYPYYTHASVFH